MPEIECDLPYPHEPHVWQVKHIALKITINGVLQGQAAYCFGDGEKNDR